MFNLIYRLLACAALLLALPLWAAEPIRIGVLSSPLKPWQPLAAELKRQIPERDFVIEMYDHSGLEQAVESRRLDFVLTNAGHYLLMQRRSGLSSPLATLVNDENGQPLDVFGGTIICRAERSDINGLKDIRGKTVAYLDHSAMGGYQMQAYELLLQGMDLQRDMQWLKVGASHTKAIEAVLSGKADVGFVRAGQIESMARSGKLDSSKLRVLNLQNMPDFPFKISTHLYPEWPFAALPNTDNFIARRVTAILLQLDRDPALLQAMQIQGFTIPADYQPVEDMLVKLRLPPFDSGIPLSFADVWKKYRWPIVGLLAGLVLLLLLAIRLAAINRRLQAAQQLLAASDEHYRATFDHAAVGIARVSTEGRFLQINQTFCKIIGYTREEVLSQQAAFQQITHPDDLAGEMVQVQRLLDGSASQYEMEKRYLHKDGHAVWVYLSVALLRDEAGMPLYFISSVTDISERKRMQDAMESLNRDFVALLENTSDFIYFKDKDGRIRFCSQSMAQITGHRNWHELAGKHDQEIFPPETAKLYSEEELPIFRDGVPLLNKTDPYFDAQGNRRWVNANKWPVFDSDGKTVIGLFGISRDITERQKIEDALQRSNADLERFAYSVSHDMRQPLRAVSGHLQLLQRSLKDKLDEDERMNLDFALEGARRMDSMIVSLLDYSRVGRKTESKQWIESRASVDEALHFLAPLIAESGADVSLNGEWPKVFASRDEMTRLFQNLVGNAIKFRESGQSPVVEVDSSLHDDLWRVSVRDHGVGIDPQQIDRLFQFFSRLQSRVRFDGTGMGLALCRRIVEHHNGRIWVESEGVGCGSVFIFELPLKTMEASAA